jgi:hypothetical protein
VTLFKFFKTKEAPGSSSLEWPEVPVDVEKSRYVTAKSFLAVIDPSIQVSGDIQMLKVDYESSISMTLEALRNALERVTRLEGSDRKVLERLVRICAKTWMECSAQPYRLIMMLPKGTGDLLSSTNRDERPLRLVTKPELKRYGNSQGETLGRGDVIAGCQGAMQPYPTR